MNRNELFSELLGLQDKGVLITGASSLISVWTARFLLAAGCRVVMTDRLAEADVRKAFRRLAEDQEDNQLDLQGEVEVIGGVDLRSRTPGEVRKPGQPSVSQMVEQALQKLNGIDLLINIAGGQEPLPAAMLTTDMFRKTVDRILFGTWNVIHEVFLQCMRAHGGRILTITADAAQGYPLMPGMGAARNALASLHQALAVEWAPMNISCCVIAPGATDTPGLERYPNHQQIRRIGIEASNQQRLLHPKEVAWLFLVMASPLARSVNGHTLMANGGDGFVTPLYREFIRSSES